VVLENYKFQEVLVRNKMVVVDPFQRGKALRGVSDQRGQRGVLELVEEGEVLRRIVVPEEEVVSMDMMVAHRDLWGRRKDAVVVEVKFEL
jgi:hypothetical protein